jgi:glycosyltransferase involved in cell wall biosynthesis
MLKSVAHVNLAKGFRGGERQTVVLIKYLKYRNPEIHQYLICRHNSEIKKYITDIPDLSVIEVGCELQGHIALANKADILQAHEAKAVHWVAIHHLLYKIPYVITRRVPQPVSNNFFNRYSFSTASATIAISNAIRESIILSFGKDVNFSGKINLIYSVLAHMESNPQEVAKIKAQYANKFLIGHIGAYVDKHKGQKVLIPAAKRFIAKHPDAIFIFLGNGRDEAELRKLTADTPEIEWLGFKNNIVDYIDSLNLFVFPSRNEGLGSVLLDIMDHRVPIVASNVDGIPEIVKDHETGLLFPNGDSDSLYNSLEEIYASKDLQQSLVETAEKKLTRFKPEFQANYYTELYNQILENNN